jgi:flagellar biosynthesis component FlhA
MKHNSYPLLFSIYFNRGEFFMYENNYEDTTINNMVILKGVLMGIIILVIASMILAIIFSFSFSISTSILNNILLILNILSKSSDPWYILVRGKYGKEESSFTNFSYTSHLSK